MKKATTSSETQYRGSLPRRVRLVLAGSHRQAEWYAREQRWTPRDWRYIAGPEFLRGYNHIELHKVGTWYERLDTPEIEALLALIRATGSVTIIEPNDQAHPQPGAAVVERNQRNRNEK